MLRALPNVERSRITKTLSISSLALIAAVGVCACDRATGQTTGQPATAGKAQAEAPAIVQPGAPGQASTVVSKVPAFHDNNYTDADVKFMQGMIHHHNQALLMAAKIRTHTASPELIAMGQKIQLSQSGEIQAMKEWLTARKQTVPMIMADGTVMDHGDMAPMPGMLTPQQMKALDTARGARFDELFLTGMIQHHKGALKMVADLREAGGGKEPNIGDFLNEVDNDQRMEIVRMYGLLGRPVEWS
ncbi:MAG TPA: DUF305 domain-containing protein [Vicinamibacterales bacterium]|nr:DUF305 domain-containing protein [Vicinamibacterales bacterium]